MHGLKTAVFHDLHSGPGHEPAGLGRAYSLLHPEDHGQARKRERLAGMRLAVPGRTEKTDDVRLEADGRKFRDAVHGGYAPGLTADGVHGLNVVAGIEQIAPHMIHG